jgi:nicotinamidase-related amidase
MLLQRDRSILVVIDVQAALLPAIPDGSAVVARIRVLLEAARRVAVPALVTEENPGGLGSTISEIATLAPADAIHRKMAFDASAEAAFMRRLVASGREQAILCGVEAHVCVLQTALGLRAAGRDVFVVSDAVSSRRSDSYAIALDRLRANGVEIVTSEMVVFEWAQSAADPAFRDLLALVK